MRLVAACISLAGALACAPALAPAPAALPAQWAPVAHLLDSVVAGGVAPGAVLGISAAGTHFFHGAGRLGLESASRPDSTTIYDLASLTKVVGLTSVTMIMVSRGQLDLDTQVRRYVPAFSGGEKDSVTLRHLLTHSSGLPAWRPLHLESATRAEAFALADSTPLEANPGTRFKYSDLGAIVLTQVVEEVAGRRIDSLVHDLLVLPLGLQETGYLPNPRDHDRIAPTELDPWRGRMLHGEVHDENASRLDGVSGHAGLFSSARDLLAFADWMLQEWDDAAAPGLGATLREFARRQELPPGSSRALGWDTPSEHSSAGTRLSQASIGHTGFTGTSIWIDPARHLVVVLLSNRVHPTRDNQRWGPVRGAVADLVAAAVDAP